MMTRIAPRTIGILGIQPELLYQIELNTWTEAIPISSHTVELVKEIHSAEVSLSARRTKARKQQLKESLLTLFDSENRAAEWERGTPPLLERLQEGAWRLLDTKFHIVDSTLSLCNSANKAYTWAKKAVDNDYSFTYLSRMHTALEEVGSSLFQSLPLFIENENVTLFLLKEKDRINTALRLISLEQTTPETVEKHILSHYKEPGLLEKHIKTRLERRGINMKLPDINHLFSNYEAN